MKIEFNNEITLILNMKFYFKKYAKSAEEQIFKIYLLTVKTFNSDDLWPDSWSYEKYNKTTEQLKNNSEKLRSSYLIVKVTIWQKLNGTHWDQKWSNEIKINSGRDYFSIVWLEENRRRRLDSN